jgi:hypothetical protein
MQGDGELPGRHDVRLHPPLHGRVGGGSEHDGFAAFVRESLVVIEAPVGAGRRRTERAERRSSSALAPSYQAPIGPEPP